MKLIKLLILVLLSTNTIAQELKKKKKSNDYYQEIYTVDKKSKLKQGNYIKLKIHSKDTLVKGNYENDKRTNTWYFYNRNNKRYLKYNYDSNVVEFLNKKYAKKDSIQIRKGNIFVRSKVDNPAYFIGYKNEEQLIISRNFQPPTDFFRIGLSGMVMTSFIINKQGNIQDIIIESSFDTSINTSIKKSIESTNNQWFPAKIEGNPVDSKMYVIYNINFTEGQDIKPKSFYKNKSDLREIYIAYYGVVREVKRYSH